MLGFGGDIDPGKVLFRGYKNVQFSEIQKSRFSGFNYKGNWKSWQLETKSGKKKFSTRK